MPSVYALAMQYVSMRSNADWRAYVAYKYARRGRYELAVAAFLRHAQFSGYVAGYRAAKRGSNGQ